ncbi:NAD(P)-dependent oxidoreductase [Fodinicola acaciae]|uniref:NAD(P)-dependent oxidoreductase n=1 Tax=Fodinicola acaciae TaxID=2681555 RepID=UPI0013D809BC|nr:NAD(P)H-binding protein [Fodinicola acaciae]
MKITVFGGTGGTGRHVIDQAVAAGHEVTAVVRDASRLSRRDLDVVTADVRDPEAIGAAVAGRDAVISALGARGREPATICTEGTAAIAAAMAAHGVRRLLVVSNSGMINDAADGPLTHFVVKPLLSRILREGWADMARMEEVVRATRLDWTILRPPMLTEGPRTAAYRTAVNHTIRGGNRISRADLADALLRYLPDAGSIRQAIAIAN